MSIGRRFRYRGLSSLAIAIVGLIATSGVALADTQTGQAGNHMFREDMNAPGVVCVYSASTPPGTFKLTSIVIKAPYLWWWNTNTAPNQQGRVGWRAMIQVALPGAYGPWDTVMSTPIQKATAYEDDPPYDLADKAPLTKRTVSFNPGLYKDEPNAHARVVLKAFWYKPSGLPAGTVTHEQEYYKNRYPSNSNVHTTACAIREA